MKEKTISFIDKIKVNWLGIIPNKPEVRKYLDACVDKQARIKIMNMHLQRVI